MTLEELALEAELEGKGFLSEAERGLAQPELPTLDRLAEALGVDLVDLVNDPYKLHNLVRTTGPGQPDRDPEQELARLKRAVRDDDQLAGEQLPNGVEGTWRGYEGNKECCYRSYSSRSAVMSAGARPVAEAEPTSSIERTLRR